MKIKVEKKRYFNRIVRFFEIDRNLFLINAPLLQKIKFVVATNFVILKNLTIRGKFTPVQTNNLTLYYDSEFAIKTFLAAAYDFFIETQKTSILPAKPVVVDIGANVGQFLFALKLHFPQSTVYCYEPNPEAFKLLKKNATNYKKTYTNNLALSDVNKSHMTFYNSNVLSEWSTLIKPHDSENYTETKVMVKKGDTVFKDIPKIDLLKVDVEGAELQVLHGLLKTLKKSKYVLLEISLERDQDDMVSSKVLTLMLNNNFRIHSIGRIFTYGPGESQSAVDIIFENKV